MNSQFRDVVYLLVAQIPSGKVMTYGQIAAVCGHPGAARVVGQVAHFGSPDLPWQRVVNAKGGLAAGFVPDGRAGQARLLEQEGMIVKNESVSIQEYLWWPSN
jgi:methylated-DNA-protein-cysteine methyltransferase-like protein